MSAPGRLSAEHELLLLLARYTLASGLEERARALAARTVAWPVVTRLAFEHGVFPLVSRNLDRLGWPGVPAGTRAELLGAARLNAARNALFARELVRVLGMFEGAGLGAIPLKGVALARSLYGETGLRVCSDLDVLVAREAVAASFRLLVGRGYEQAEEYSVGPDEIDRLLDSNMEYGFRGRAAGLDYLLELHWDIAWRWRGDHLALADLWDDARQTTFQGAQARALSPEWELIYLSVHAARHRWRELKWLVDIHELCSREGLDWERAGDKARRFGWDEVLAVTLSVCRALFGTAVPARLAAGSIPPWLGLYPAEPPATSTWQDALLPARLVSGRGGKFRYLARLLLVPTLSEHRLFRLPAALGAAYYLLRPLRLGARWGGSLVRSGLHAARAGAQEP